MANDKYTFTEGSKSELIFAFLMFLPITYCTTGLF